MLFLTLAAVAVVAATAADAKLRKTVAAGDSVASISAKVDAFKAAIGPAGTAVSPGFQPGSLRPINWDAPSTAGPMLSDQANDAFDTFNADSAPLSRAQEFEVAEGSLIQVSSDVGTQRFGDIEPSYTDEFVTFSGLRLFSPIGSNEIGVKFFVAGSKVAGTVNGFGAVFIDVDHSRTSYIDYFSQGERVKRVYARPGKLSFVGLRDTRDAPFDKVVLRLGNAPMAKGLIDGLVLPTGEQLDVVVLDDFFAGEPQPVVDERDDDSSSSSSSDSSSDSSSSSD